MTVDPITVEHHAWSGVGAPCAVCGTSDREARCQRVPVEEWRRRIDAHRSRAGLPAGVAYDFIARGDRSIASILRTLSVLRPQAVVDFVSASCALDQYQTPLDFALVAAAAADQEGFRARFDAIFAEHEREVALVRKLHASPAYRALQQQSDRLDRHDASPPPIAPLDPPRAGEVGWHVPKGNHWHFSGFAEFVTRFAGSRAIEEWRRCDGFLVTIDEGDLVLRTLVGGDPTPDDAWRFRSDAYVWQWHAIKAKLPDLFERFVVITDEWRRRVGAAFHQQARLIEAFGDRPLSFRFAVAGSDRVDRDLEPVQRACYLREYISRSSRPPYQR